MDVPFTILEFRDEGVPSALFLEDGLKVTTSVDDAHLLDRHLEVFHQIARKAERTGSFAKHAARILEQYYPDPA